MTYEQLSLPIFQNVNVTVSDFRAKVSALAESEGDLQTQEALYSLKSCGWLKSESLNFYSLKMLRDCSTMMGGATFATIITTMAELGYSVEWQVLNSKNFGIPQHRLRVFIIGHLGNGSGRKVFPVRPYGETASELQRFEDRNRVVSTPLKVGGSMNTNGIYIADRQTDVSKGQRIPQALNVAISERMKPIETEIAAPLTARDYKGVRNQDYGTVVMEKWKR